MRQEGQVRQSIAVSVVLVLILFFTPLISIAPFQISLFSNETPMDETEESFVSGKADGEIVLQVLDGDTVREMDLGTYLLGVVRAEMPASFELEALKAQTVAARTYTLYKMKSGGNHGETADICVNPSCCQAYVPKEQAEANWKQNAAQYEKKVETAVKETDGQAILYEGAPILAVFHSSSAGMTRAAGAVWVNDMPYLQAVSSPETEDKIPNYHSRVEISRTEFCNQIKAVWPEADFSGAAEDWLADVISDEAGNVISLQAGGVPIKGSELRNALGLRSACFEWEVQEETIVFYVTGYGHGVGLSQYGANQMAENGATYREILTHYYTGVTIGEWAMEQALQ